jgi:large subunit ribosomal protein L23
MTPTERARYDRLRARGELNDAKGNPIPEEQWIADVNKRRSRVRGLLTRQMRGGKEEVDAVGRRVYLPNIIMRMVRNQTLPGQPYNPYEATFRIPQSVTKTDIRSLLLAVYGVQTTYIRTDNYISPWYRTLDGPQRRPQKTYKRAVVGLVEPFYYPKRLEDMGPKERTEREEWIEKHFAIQDTRNLQKEELLRMTKGQGRMSWKFNAPYATKRSHILRLVNERRDQRETLVSEFAEEIRSLKSQDEAPTYKKVKSAIKAREPTPEKDSNETTNV